MIVHYPFKVHCQRFTYLSPSPDIGQPHLIATVQERAGKILVRDRVTPPVQGIKGLLTHLRPWIVREDLWPELYAEPPEVRAEVPRIRISGFELPSLDQPLANDHPYCGARDRGDQVLDALRVEVSTERREPRRKQHHVRLIDLLRGVPPSAAGAADGAVGGLDLVEGAAGLGSPGLERAGGHRRQGRR
jgi:hypothetical protein